MTDPKVQELLEMVAQHLPDRCRCIHRPRTYVECSEHRMARLAREILREQKEATDA